jgi:hypothetical protein
LEAAPPVLQKLSSPWALQQMPSVLESLLRLLLMQLVLQRVLLLLLLLLLPPHLLSPPPTPLQMLRLALSCPLPRGCVAGQPQRRRRFPGSHQ